MVNPDNQKKEKKTLGDLKKGFLLQNNGKELKNKKKPMETRKATKGDEPAKEEKSEGAFSKQSGVSLPPLKVEPPQVDAAASKGDEKRDQLICWNCHAQGTLLKCSGCMRALYCDQQCQEADWARHGGYCEARQRKKRLAEVD